MKIRKIIAIGTCGLAIGGIMSVLSASPATARAYASCDSKVAKLESAAASDYAKGKLTDTEYSNITKEIAAHRLIWGC